jgi:hypothetical protein
LEHEVGNHLRIKENNNFVGSKTKIMGESKGSFGDLRILGQLSKVVAHQYDPNTYSVFMEMKGLV